MGPESVLIWRLVSPANLAHECEERKSFSWGQQSPNEVHRPATNALDVVQDRLRESPRGRADTNEAWQGHSEERTQITRLLGHPR